jgi:hypothetical protein
VAVQRAKVSCGRLKEAQEPATERHQVEAALTELGKVQGSEVRATLAIGCPESSSAQAQSYLEAVKAKSASMSNQELHIARKDAGSC